MTAQHRLRLARFGEPLERVRARRLQHPVARDRIAFGQHQRLVHQRAEMIERRPRIDALVARDVLRGLQREAAGEHAESPEHGLLVGREQRVAPFERRAQRLMAAQNDARPPVSRLKRSSQARAQALDAEQRQPRGGELDRERNAVEPPADLDHRRQIGRGQREARIDGLRARYEQLDRAGLQRVSRVGGAGTASAPSAIDVLVGGLERFLARDEDAARAARRRVTASTSAATASARCSQLSSTSSARCGGELRSQRSGGRAVAGEPHAHAPAPRPTARARRRRARASSTHQTPSG